MLTFPTSVRDYLDAGGTRIDVPCASLIDHTLAVDARVDKPRTMEHTRQVIAMLKRLAVEEPVNSQIDECLRRARWELELLHDDELAARWLAMVPPGELADLDRFAAEVLDHHGRPYDAEIVDDGASFRCMATGIETTGKALVLRHRDDEYPEIIVSLEAIEGAMEGGRL